MSIFWGVAICCVVFSWFRAKRLGIPWFSWGKEKAQPIRYHRLKTENIKPKSPWLKPTKRAKKKAKKARKPKIVSFNRLDELTHNAETSRRLVEHVRRLHPDRDLNWCEEKALYDMKRDRMA